MDWSYVAGYFDGEGHVGMHACGSRKKRACKLEFTNTHLKSLEAIRDFMGAGNLRRTKDRPDRLIKYSLTVGRRLDIMRIIDAMLPHSIVKRDGLQALRLYVEHYVLDRSKEYGKVAAVSTEQLTQWYHGERRSFGWIAKHLHVNHTAVLRAFRLRGIQPRPQAQAGREAAASPERRQKLSETHKRLWQNPEYRSSRMRILQEKRMQRQQEQPIQITSFTLSLPA